MPRILVVDDDADQASLRKTLFEHVGHAVSAAFDPDSARLAFAAFDPDLVVMDLRLPHAADGLALIREFREQKPGVRILVLSGWTADVTGRPEARMVDGIIAKPAQSARLMRIVGKLAMCLALLAPMFGQTGSYPFRAAAEGEMTASLTMSSPGSNWGREGQEAAMADVRVDSGPPFQVMLYAGEQERAYRVFLGKVQPGEHRLSIVQNNRYSAPGTSVRVASVKVEPAAEPEIVARAPILSARENTIGKFTDAPMIAYAERIRESGVDLLQYTIIFTNEDGGTSTRALMARWGRTTDIEYVYKVNPSTNRATIQARNHREEEFQGEHEGLHPLLMPVTDNNMVSGGTSPIRYRVLPALVDLSHHSREHVMDEDPVTYRVASQELEREHKLRPFGELDGEKISDPRNYLYVELKLANQGAGVTTRVRLKGEDLWRSSDLGRLDCAIGRSEWIRTTVELPPGTKADQVAQIGFSCAILPDDQKRMTHPGSCRVEAVGKVFLLDREYRPGSSIYSTEKPADVAAGTMRVFAVE